MKATHSLVAVFVLCLVAGCGRRQVPEAGVAQPHVQATVTSSIARARSAAEQSSLIADQPVNADVLGIQTTAELYATALTQIAQLNDYSKLTAHQMSNMPYHMLIAIRDKMYELHRRHESAECAELIKLLMHATNKTAYNEIQLLRVLGVSLMEQDKRSEAEPLFQEVVDYRLAHSQSDTSTDSDALGACFGLAGIYLRRGDKSRALDIARVGWEIAQASSLAGSVVDARGLHYADVLIMNRKYEEAYNLLTSTQWRDERSLKEAKLCLDDLPQAQQRAEENIRREALVKEKIEQMTPEQRKLFEENGQRIKNFNNQNTGEKK
jgi:hypothetical protein